MPLVLTNDFKVCNTTFLTLKAKMSYQIIGNYSNYTENTKIYISASNGEISLRDSIIDTLTAESIDENGDFQFSKIYRFNEVTTLAVWVEVAFTTGEMASFSAKAAPLEVEGYFKYSYRDVIMPDLINGNTPDSNANYSYYVEGTINITFSETSVEDGDNYLSTTAFAYNNTTEDYIYPEDGNFNNLSNAELVNNISRGLDELDAGIIVPDVTNINYQIFLFSLNAFGHATRALAQDQTNFQLSYDWGTPSSTNDRVLVWLASQKEISGDFQIQDLNNDDIQGEADGITWEISKSDKVCLAGNTSILMADGSIKQIKDIEVGDQLLSKDGRATTVYKTMKSENNYYHTLYFFEGDIVIDETGPHAFYNVEEGVLRYLSTWNIGDHALTDQDKEVKLLRKEVLFEPAERYGILTESGYCYANGLLSGAVLDTIEEADSEDILKMISGINKDNLFSLMNA